MTHQINNAILFTKVFPSKIMESQQAKHSSTELSKSLTKQMASLFVGRLMAFIFAIFIGIFYFFMIRPQRRSHKEHQELVNELRSGDSVITTGGIYGKIESVSDESVVIKVESGATMRVAKNSVALKREE